MTEPDRYSWARAGVEDLGGGVHRIPLPLPMAGLKAVNVYALIDDQGVDLIDAGMGLANARERLTAGLKELGCELGDIRNFFITHVHRDHYTLAVDLRRSRYGSISLGVGEQANLAAARALAQGDGAGEFYADLRWMGAGEIAEKLGADANVGAGRPTADEWEEPDRWITDGTELEFRARKLRAIHTPGHTRGHVVYHDVAGGLLFAGDHVLPHITPTIGMEPARNRNALRDYMDSLRLVLTLPDARLLPAHGPVQDSTHKRVHELLAHHEQRLGDMLAAMTPGRSSAYEVAQAIRWTRRQLPFSELETLSQLLAVGETAAHLELLMVRGQLTRHSGADGTDHYEVVSTLSAPE
jgi:glyoxylase-like metal-dependent hydrolase (beta-lactamase superfamily II)